MNRSNSQKFTTIKGRCEFIVYKSDQDKKIKCDQDSLAGVVSQRACVYCGARVVLNPITDAYHLIHGPIGCASYTWDIRGSLSSGAETYRQSFSTDLRERDIVFGGENRLIDSIDEIVSKYNPKVIFVYATCVVGVIGDDIEAVCRMAEKKYGIRAIPVQASGFSGNKSDGYRAACNAMLKLMEKNELPPNPQGINILGDFNLAGEIWILQDYLNSCGIKVNTRFTGDSSCQEIINAPASNLNIVQCAGSMVYMAKKLKEIYGIPFIRISFVGIEDTINSLRKIAHVIGDKDIKNKVENMIKTEQEGVGKELAFYRRKLTGKKAAVYVGGGFKAISLIKQFNSLGIRTVMVGTQTGSQEDYETINKLVDKGTVILDDANPAELEHFIRTNDADIIVGGVKERPLAYKLGLAFCDHNHERKHPLTGFEGAVNFAREIDQTVNSPVWKLVKREERWLENDYQEPKYKSL